MNENSFTVEKSPSLELNIKGTEEKVFCPKIRGSASKKPHAAVPVIKPAETERGTFKTVFLQIPVNENKIIKIEEIKSIENKVSLLPPKNTFIPPIAAAIGIVIEYTKGSLKLKIRKTKEIISAPKRVVYAPKPVSIPSVKIIGIHSKTPFNPPLISFAMDFPYKKFIFIL